jgi:hypothetical protein
VRRGGVHDQPERPRDVVDLGIRQIANEGEEPCLARAGRRAPWLANRPQEIVARHAKSCREASDQLGGRGETAPFSSRCTRGLP